MRFALMKQATVSTFCAFYHAPRCDFALRHSAPLQGRFEAVLIVRCSETEASDAALLESVVLFIVVSPLNILRERLFSGSSWGKTLATGESNGR